MATITSLTFQIFSRYDGGGLRQARRDVDDFDNSTRRNTNSLNSWSGRIALATQSAAAFGPALIPIGAAAIAAGAGLATMAGTAGVALGGYGLVLDKAVKETLKLAKAHKDLNPAQQQFITAVNGMKAAWTGMSTGMNSQVLATATKGVEGITNAIKGMTPLLHAIHPLVLGIASDFERWTRSDSFKQWINLIRANAVPALDKLVAIGKDVGRVLGDGFKAFLPAGQSMLTVLKNGADELRKWADGGGFKRFIDYVTANKGPVNEFFRALGDALRNVTVAMRGLGEPSLKLATALLQIVAALPPSVIQAMAVGFVAIRTAAQAAAIYTAAMAAGSRAVAIAVGLWNIAQTALIATMVAFDVAVLPAIGIMALIVIAVAAIGFAIYELVTHWTTVWNAIKSAAVAVWDFLGSKWGWFIALFGPIGLLITLAAHWRQIWDAIRVSAVAVWDALKTAWSATVGALKTAWDATAGALAAAWHAVWNGIRAAAITVWNALGSKWGWFIALLGPVGWLIAIAMHWKQVWGAIKIAAEAVWNALRIAWTATVNALRTAWTTVGNALRATWQAVWNTMRTAAQAVWNALRAAWNAFLTGIRTVWNTVSGALRAAWQTFWNVLRTSAQAVWNAIRTGWQTLLNAIRTVWNTVSSALRAAWTTFWNALKTAAQTVWDAMKTAWNTFTTAIKDLWDKASAILKAAWENTWNTLKSTASAIWDEIKDVVEKGVNACIDIVNGLIGAWNAVAGAVHLPTIGKVGHVNFAEGGVAGEKFAGGGVLSGYRPGTDTVNAVLSPGEGVLVPEAVSALGADWVHGANHYFSNGRAGRSSGGFMNHFADGGIMGRMSLKFAGGGDVPNPTGGMAGDANPANPNKSGGSTGGSAGMGGDAKDREKFGTHSDAPGAGLVKKGLGIAMGMFGLPDIASVTAAFMKWINAARGLGGFIKPAGGAIGDVGMKMLKTVVDKIKELIQKALAAAALLGGGKGGKGTPVSGKVGNLRGVVIAALKRAGYPVTAGNISAMLQRIQIESGGNPNAVNNWDINARNGTPSIGLAQVIGPTFAAYGSGNIYDPVDNVTASLNYIRARYGGRIPTGRGGYASGTPGATTGWAMVGEQGPELVNFRGGESVTSNPDLARAIGHGGGGGPVHVNMPIHVSGNLDKQAVEKLDTEVLPKLRIMLSKGTGSRLG